MRGMVRCLQLLTNESNLVQFHLTPILINLCRRLLSTNLVNLIQLGGALQAAKSLYRSSKSCWPNTKHGNPVIADFKKKK